MEELKQLMLEKANAASKAIKKVDIDLYRFWNLVIAEKRLHIVKEDNDRQEKKIPGDGALARDGL